MSRPAPARSHVRTDRTHRTGPTPLRDGAPRAHRPGRPSRPSAGAAGPRTAGIRHSGAGDSGPRNSGPRNSGAGRAAALIWNEIPLELIDEATMPTFEQLGLPRGLADALGRHGVSRPFPIQAAVIADVLAGRDVLGRAATGSGKTLAFGLPLIARLEGARSEPRRPRGLVLVPTRELAMQVTDALEPLASARGLSVRLVAGGLPIGRQITSLERGVDILVCTPGRLMDLMERRAADLGAVAVTVLDEADHMADLGFLPAVRRILDQTPSDGQRLLFSATLDGDVSTLIHSYLVDPAAHAVASATAQVDTMEHFVLRVGPDDKVDVAAHIGSREGRTLMFVRTKHGADRLSKQLGRLGVAAGALHGGRSQSQRTKALTAFRDGSVPVLIATDVAARGIHVDGVSLVLHVDPPAESKDYLHRSGRTARAGASGRVVTLTTSDQDRPMRRILSDAAVTAEHHSVHTGDPALAAVTGARAPSGVPVRPVAETAPRHERGAPRPRGAGSGGDRSRRSGSARSGTGSAGTGSVSTYSTSTGSAGAYTAGTGSSGTGSTRAGSPGGRHPQHAERRPRRATSPARSF